MWVVILNCLFSLLKKFIEQILCWPFCSLLLHRLLQLWRRKMQLKSSKLKCRISQEWEVGAWAAITDADANKFANRECLASAFAHRVAKTAVWFYINHKSRWQYLSKFQHQLFLQSYVHHHSVQMTHHLRCQTAVSTVHETNGAAWMELTTDTVVPTMPTMNGAVKTERITGSVGYLQCRKILFYDFFCII